MVALPRLRRLHGPLRRGLRPLLLLRAVGHGRPDAGVVLLRVHRRLLLGPVADAGLRRVEEQPVVRAGDVQGDQERVEKRVEGRAGGGRGTRGEEGRKEGRERRAGFSLSFLPLPPPRKREGELSFLVCLSLLPLEARLVCILSS